MKGKQKGKKGKYEKNEKKTRMRGAHGAWTREKSGIINTRGRSKLLWQHFETGQLYVYEFVNKQQSRTESHL